MGFKYTGDALLGTSLTVESSKPLDNRTVVDSSEELYSIPSKYAYQGMTVANIKDGNIYMLIDKANINKKEGWKASYESIQIIACTEAEYKEWNTNTTENFTPIDESKPFLHNDTYYYIYEDSLDPETSEQKYLSAAWGKGIEDQLKDKALNSTVTALTNKVDADIKNLSDNYLTKTDIVAVYAPLTALDNNNPESTISIILNDYYTKTKSDEIFVTKDFLLGTETGEGEYIFVTTSKYNTDQQAIQDILSLTLKTNTDGSLTSLTVNQLKSTEGLVVDLKADGLYIGEDRIAVKSEIPKLECLSQKEYEALTEIDQDKYYFTYGERSLVDTGYVRSEDLVEDYYSKKEIDAMGIVSVKVENEILIL